MDSTNEPVAWIDKNTGKPRMEGFIQTDYDIPLYTHPAKTLTDEEILNVAMELNLIHYYDTDGQWSGVTNEELIDSVKNRNDERLIEILKPFANAILKKASEK